MAKSKFSISEGMLNSISKNVDKSNLIDAKENFKFDYIDIDKLKINSKNFYPIVDIETLAEDISIYGLNHNLVVRPIENGFYEIISGERRYTALKSLVDKGDNKYSKVPCKIVNLNDVDSEITLIQSNAQTRELTDSDKLKQIERLTELYKEKKKKGEKVTNIRKLVSKDIGLSEGQVAKYSTVSNNLIPELRAILDEGNLTISNATEFSSLSEENQNIILDIINKRVDISRNEAVEIKKQLKEVESEKNKIIEREKQKSEEILKLKLENESKSNEINLEIEKVKKELLANSNKEKEELENKLKALENDKNELENEKVELETSINNLNEKIKLEIENKANKKIDEIKNKFEEDKLKLKIENEQLKEKLNKNNNLSEEQIRNQELKIRLNNTRTEISKIAGLMANNKIMDEETLKLVKCFENELRFLNEQILIYNNQEIIK
ncbi:ParB N-terminal domain-containing protein [uncultured Tyzzerella sp.]|uniref:ParB/RepB/Spo0J family partition protein n=1 Tax=uncultured Tyzzerella sp. TaxID=2321398 RepID=UPI002943CFB0|nr:ParB N-terminal domain-containing protein [uncultured Tyzzerella sp.]